MDTQAISQDIGTAASIITLIQAAIAVWQYFMSRRHYTMAKKSGAIDSSVGGSGGGAVIVIVLFGMFSVALAITVHVLPIASDLIPIATAQVIILSSSAVIDVQSRGQRRFRRDINVFAQDLVREINTQIAASMVQRGNTFNAQYLAEISSRLDALTVETERKREFEEQILGAIQRLQEQNNSLETNLRAITELLRDGPGRPQFGRW